MQTSRFLLTGLFALLCAMPVFSQDNFDFSLDAKLPTDPAVRVGTLSNGMKYYIRQNSLPAGRAEFRLAVQVGSIMEDDDQLGLAHFVEHMAFNGTENFEKNETVEYLESIGMRFGADLNAFTSYDMTVYMLQVPTEDAEVLHKGMLILHDWAGGILFEEEAIDMERGVVVEEMRSRRSGDSRVNEEHTKVIYGDTKYADRSPIGKKEILLNAPYDAFRRFYRDWYRPDLMAIVAVGDFDPDKMEADIKKMFSKLENPKNPRERTRYTIPMHEGTRYSLAFDPEATNPGIAISYKLGQAGRETVGDYRNQIVDGIISGMLNERLQEVSREAGSPLVFAFGGAGLGLANARTFGVNGRVKEGRYLDGIRTILTELERIRRHGFTAEELARQQKSMVVMIDQYYQERDKTESSAYAREYYSNHTTGESFPGITFERAMYNRFVPSLTLAEINQAARAMISDNGRSITVGGPTTDATDDLDKDDIEDVVEEVMESKIDPYMEEAVEGELFSGTPTPGTIVQRSRINEIGVTEWKLSNGMKVILRPTDFKNNEILMTAYSPGGTSIIPDEDYIPAATASAIVSQGGLGDFDRTTLGRYMSDKVAGSSVSIGQLYENVSGSSSNEDIETLFQMVHMQFTSPRKDAEAFEFFKSQVAAQLETAGASPEGVFRDSIQHFLSGYHPRSAPWTMETLEEMDLDKSFAIYLDRFSDAGDFTFVFVGSFTVEQMEPLVTTYLASLPGTDHTENWRDLGMSVPGGEVRKVIRKGIEPKAQVQITYHGDFDWSLENRVRLRSMVEVMQMKVRETLREEKGGVYSPGVWTQVEQYPNSEYAVNIFFGCDPERVDELIADVERIVAEMKSEAPSQEYVDKVAEIQRRQRETSLKENQSWLQSLAYYYRNNEPATNILTIVDLPDTLTPQVILQTAREHLGEDRATFILLPE